MTDPWFIIFTAPCKEAFVADSLSHIGYETIFLHERARNKKGNEVKRARWPRYILLRPVNGQGLYEAAWHQGVVSFVSAAGEPCRLSSAYVDTIIAEADEHGCIGWEPESDPVRTTYQPGDTLRITVGPFTGLQAVVKLDTGRKIWAECGGLPVELRPGDVKLVRPGRAARCPIPGRLYR